MSELERPHRRSGRELLAPLDRGALETEELEHRVAHARHGREDAARQHEQPDERDRERAAEARRG